MPVGQGPPYGFSGYGQPSPIYFVMTFKDHFSGHAQTYREARPHYPEALFDWLSDLAPARGEAERNSISSARPARCHLSATMTQAAQAVAVDA